MPLVMSKTCYPDVQLLDQVQEKLLTSLARRPYIIKSILEQDLELNIALATKMIPGLTIENLEICQGCLIVVRLFHVQNTSQCGCQTS